LGSIPAELGPREYFNDLGVKLWCRMLGVLDKCRKYGFGVDLGGRIRPAMALDGRFTGSSFVRKLLQTKGHAARRPSPLQRGYLLGKVFEGISRLSPKTRARLRTFHYYRWNIGTEFSELRTKTDSVASGVGPSQSPSPLPE
jgi:hypothetical protein